MEAINGYLVDAKRYEATKAQIRDSCDTDPYFLSRIDSSKINGPILDFGCGPGTELVTYLAPLAESRVTEVIGLDLSLPMIQHAKAHSSHPRVTYLTGDIMSQDFKIHIDKFDLIYSRYVLHLIPNWRQVLLRLRSLLSCGGQLAVTLATERKMFKFYRSLSENEIFGPYMKNLAIQEWVDGELSSAENVYREALEECGYSVTWIESHYQDRAIKTLGPNVDFYMSVNPFLKDVPRHLIQSLRALYTAEMQMMIEAEANGDLFQSLSFHAVKR